MIQFKDVSFNYKLLQSKVFPGIILGFQIILCFHLFTPYKMGDILLIINKDKVYLVIAMFLLVIMAIMLGVIIDTINDFLFPIFGREVIRDLIKKYGESFNIFEFINTSEQLTIFEKTVDNIYHSYETYSNTFLSMLPGVFLLPYWFNSLDIRHSFIIIFVFIYIIVCILLFKNAINTFRSSVTAFNMWYDKYQKKSEKNNS